MNFKIAMQRSDLCNFSDAYIVVNGYVAVTNLGDSKRNKSGAFKNNVPFINSISKVNGVQIDNAEDIDVVIPMYNFLEYSKNYKKTAGSLWNFYRDEPSNPLSSNSESFKYKASITGYTCNLGVGKAGYVTDKVGKNETKIVALLKHLTNFGRTLNIPLINCEIELILTWCKNCSLADMTVRDAGNNNDPLAIVASTGLKLQMKDIKLYVQRYILVGSRTAVLSPLPSICSALLVDSTLSF